MSAWSALFCAAALLIAGSSAAQTPAADAPAAAQTPAADAPAPAQVAPTTAPAPTAAGTATPPAAAASPTAPVAFDQMEAPPASVASAPAAAAPPPPAHAAPTSQAAAITQGQPSSEELLEPVRARRPFVIAGELGWNSLSGLGVVAAYHFVPELAVELGMGISLAGLKSGVRVRGNLLRSNWTPTVGLGFSVAGGLGDAFDVDPEDADGREARLKVLATPMAQFSAGVTYTADGGGYFTALAGYAVLLRKKNVKLISGDDSLRHDFQRVLGSGLVISLSGGYAF